MSNLAKVNLSSNYDKIVNFLYENDDQISRLLIECYQKYIFNIKNKNSISNVDKVMSEYIKKSDFYKTVQEYFKADEIYDSFDKIMLKIIKLYKLYEQQKYKNIKNTRWL